MKMRVASGRMLVQCTQGSRFNSQNHSKQINKSAFIHLGGALLQLQNKKIDMQIWQLVFPIYEYYLRTAIILPISFYLAILFIYVFIKGSILFWHQIWMEQPMIHRPYAYDKEAHCGWSKWHRNALISSLWNKAEEAGRPENPLWLLREQQKWPEDLPWGPPLGISTSSTQHQAGSEALNTKNFGKHSKCKLWRGQIYSDLNSMQCRHVLKHHRTLHKCIQF